VALKDSGIGIAKWVVGQFKQFGTTVYAGMLIGATKVKEFGASIMGWVKQQYDAIAGQIGVAFNDAVSGIKSTVRNAASAVGKTASNIANKASGYAGKALGAIQGFLQEFFERFNNFKGTDSLTILSEAVKYNAQVI
jgi:hypothetical protein